MIDRIQNYSEQVSQLQNDVFGEFDKPNRQGIIKLVQFYIFFGMGVEAISVLNDLDFEDEQSKLLAEMASILEDVPSISHGILENFYRCGCNRRALCHVTNKHKKNRWSSID